VVPVVTHRRALALALVALLGCVRWQPLASSELVAVAPTLPQRRMRVLEPEGLREIFVHRVRGATVEGWEAARGREGRVDLSAVRQAWVEAPNEALTGVLVGGVYAAVFLVSALVLLIGRP